MIDLKVFNPIHDDSKKIFTINFHEHPEIFEGVLKVEDSLYEFDALVWEEMVHNSGISKSVDKVLRKSNQDIWKSTILALYDYYYEGKINLLSKGMEIVGYYSPDKLSILNHDFINAVFSTVVDYSTIQVDNYYYNKDSSLARIVLYPELVTDGWKLGVMIENNESGNVNCTRVATNSLGETFYLPSKYYRVSSSRYKKIASNSIDALNIMLLKVIDDMSKESWYHLSKELDMHTSNCKKILTTYEEYRYAVRVAKRVIASSDMEQDESDEIIERIFSGYEDFESNYPEIDDAKKSYIWRCSALSDNKIINLISSLGELSNDYSLYPECKVEIYYAMGEYLTLDKISTELARRHER